MGHTLIVSKGEPIIMTTTKTTPQYDVNYTAAVESVRREVASRGGDPSRVVLSDDTLRERIRDTDWSDADIADYYAPRSHSTVA